VSKIAENLARKPEESWLNSGQEKHWYLLQSVKTRLGTLRPQIWRITSLYLHKYSDMEVKLTTAST
jgi:hypothetical protein